MKRLVSAAILTAVLLFPGLVGRTADAATVFANGSFETDNWISVHGAVIPSGWTGVTSGVFTYGFDDAFGGSGSGTHYETPFGNQFVVLGSYDNSALSYIEQNVSGFSQGAQYALSFAMSPEVTYSPYIHQIDVTVTGHVATTTRFTIGHSTNGLSWNQWYAQTLNFTADATNLTFRFQGVAGDPYSREAGLDNLSITEVAPAPSSVPEPTSLALLSGLGVMGLASVRKRRKMF